MREYHKIETLLDRDEKTFKVQIGKWRLPEFAYLAENAWLFTEKVDGTNVRVMWDGRQVRFGGKTDAAQMPTFLLARLQDLFPPEKLALVFGEASACLYGEGYGAKIQGGKYKADGVNCVLFDVLVDTWWLERDNIEDVATKLEVQVVPMLRVGTLLEAIEMVRGGSDSTWGNFRAEGLVVRPKVTLFSRKGERLLGKIKTRDF